MWQGFQITKKKDKFEYLTATEENLEETHEKEDFMTEQAPFHRPNQCAREID